MFMWSFTPFYDRARRERSAFWGPRSVEDVSRGPSFVDCPSTYYSREQPRDLSGTLARALPQRAADGWDTACQPIDTKQPLMSTWE